MKPYDGRFPTKNDEVQSFKETGKEMTSIKYLPKMADAGDDNSKNSNKETDWEEIPSVKILAQWKRYKVELPVLESIRIVWWIHCARNSMDFVMLQ